MKNILILLLCFISIQMFAQKPEAQVAQGNKKFNTRNYAQAETLYRSAASKDDKNTNASYNKGNSIYRQYQTNESINSYQQAFKTAKTKEEKHYISHNLGNAYMKQKNYGAAVEAYKNALRNNPNDEETRYNFALAKQMQKDNPDQNKDNKYDKNEDKKDQDKKNDQKDQDKNDPKDQGDDDKDKDNKEDKDDKGDNPKDDKKDQENRDPKQQKQDQSKQQMENMLNALDNHEQKVRERIQAREKEGKPVQSSSTKDW